MQKKKYLKLIIIFLSIGTFSCSNNVLAFEYAVAPAIIDIKAQARDIIKKSVTITNESDYKVDIYPVVNNFLIEEAGVDESAEPGAADRATSLANWIQFPRAVVELESGESKTIVFSIMVNLEARPGIYHAKISFPSGSTRDQAEQATDDSPFVTVNLEVIEKVNEHLELRKFSSLRSLFVNLPASLLYSVENIGNRDISPKGEVIIYDRKGKEVASTKVNAEGKIVSPGNILDLKSNFSGGSFFGRYKAFLNIKYGDNQSATLNDTIYFYIIPWDRLLLIFFVAAISAWILSILIHRRRNHGRHSPISHFSFHSSAGVRQEHSRPNRHTYYQNLGQAVNRSHSTISGSTEKNNSRFSLTIGKKNKNNQHHGHVMDLRMHKRK